MISKNTNGTQVQRLRQSPARVIASSLLILGAAILGPVQQARADYLGTKTIRMFVDPADLSVIADGIGTADQFRLIAEVTPGDTGSNSAQSGWNTFYTVPGMLVGGVSIVDNVNGNYVTVNAKDTDAAYDGWGKRGAKGYSKTSAHLGEGRVNEVQQDSGIFYSTDPRTRYVPGVGSPPAPGAATYGTVLSTGGLQILNQPVPVHNAWDRDQVLGFGTKTAVSGNAGTGNTPLVTMDGGTTWRGTGSPVAGPHTRYTNDYNPRCGTSGSDAGVAGQAGSSQNAFAYDYRTAGSSANRTDQSNPAPEFYDAGTKTFKTSGNATVDTLGCIGPWRRIKYQGSKIGGSGPILQATEQGTIQNTAAPVGAASAGDDIVGDFGGFLPNTTNAIRFVAGARRVGDIELFAVTIRITDRDTFLANIKNLCVMSLGSDTADVSAKDNNWRYYEPIFLQGSGSSQACVDLSASGNLFKRITHVNDLPSGGLTSQPGNILSYTVKFTNTTAATIDSLALSDQIGPGLNISNSANLDLVASTTAGCAWAPGGTGGHTGYNATFSGSGSGGTLSVPATDNAAGFPVGFNGPVNWTNVNGLAPGDSVTVYMCAKVIAGAQGDILENKSLASYPGCGAAPCMTSSATTAVGNLLSGSVYNDLNDDGNFQGGEPGIEGVSIALYLNDGAVSGQFDGTNTYVSQTTTDANGFYNFTALPAASYILVETDPGGYVSTGNIIHTGNPAGCTLQAGANRCNVIGPINLLATSTVTGRDFYDFAAALPVLTKGFSPNSIAVGGTATLTFTVDNSVGATVPQTGLFFTDLLPTSLQLANGLTAIGAACGGPIVIKDAADATLAAGSTSVKVTGLSIAAGEICTISVSVTNKAGAINTSCPNAPTFTNTAANITAISPATPPAGLINGVQPSCLNVTPTPPTLTKSFAGAPPSFPIGGSTTLTFTITNPAQNPGLTGLEFTDELPSGLQLLNGTVTGSCSGYTITDDADLPALPAPLAAGSKSILVTNLSIGPGPSSCTITVNITNVPLQVNSSCANFPAAFTNDATNITTITGMSNGVQPTCVLVLPLTPNLAKSFNPDVINNGEVTTLTFTVTNPTPNIGLSDVGFTDNLPDGLQIAAAQPVVGGTCSNAVLATTATPGQTAITVSGLQIDPGQSACTVTVKVTNKTNRFNASCVGNPSDFTNGPGNVVNRTDINNVQASSCVRVNAYTLGITKTPSATVVKSGDPLSFTVVVTNNGPSAADGAIITDPAIPFYGASAIVCQQLAGNATCPSPLTIQALQGAGMTVANFPSGAAITLRIDGVSSLANGQLTNTVTVSPPPALTNIQPVSASATVTAPIGVIPTLGTQALLALMLLLGVAAFCSLKKSVRRG